MAVFLPPGGKLLFNDIWEINNNTSKWQLIITCNWAQSTLKSGSTCTDVHAQAHNAIMPKSNNKTARHWCFTVNDSEEVKNFDKNVQGMKDTAKFKKAVKYLVYQHEKGDTTSRLHVQGYIELAAPVRLTGVKTILGLKKVHLEQRAGTRDEARKYCMKIESRASLLEQPIEIGQWTEQAQGKRSDLLEAVNLLKQYGLTAVAEQQPSVFVRNNKGLRELQQTLVSTKAKSTIREQLVIVLYGRPGSGKSHLSFELGQRLGRDVYPLSPPQKGGTIWFNNYESEDILTIDEFNGWMDYQMLLRVTDKYPLQVQSKGGMMWANWKVVLITSMSHWRDWYPGQLYKGGQDLSALERRINSTWRMIKREDGSRTSQRWISGDNEDAAFDNGEDHDAIGEISKVVAEHLDKYPAVGGVEVNTNEEVLVKLSSPPPSPDISGSSQEISAIIQPPITPITPDGVHTQLVTVVEDTQPEPDAEPQAEGLDWDWEADFRKILEGIPSDSDDDEAFTKPEKLKNRSFKEKEKEDEKQKTKNKFVTPTKTQKYFSSDEDE